MTALVGALVLVGEMSFITPTIMSSAAVDKVLDQLPAKGQLAVKSTLPNIIESATQTLGEKTFDSVGKKINDKLGVGMTRAICPEAPVFHGLQLWQKAKVIYVDK